MMNVSSRLAAVAIASLFFAGSALAQTAAPAAAPAATTTAKKAEKPRTPESLECSKEADAKGLHGKDRKKFMSQCKKEAKAKGGATDAKK
jgi:psiF repeat-containing protein